ncbi:MAG: hypothetical protein GXY44_10925 [Phycisphaerales bacterium]|nr:hypothetical protein [Phycisphaerales bacterium]
MSSALAELLDHLRSADLNMAAFEFVTELRDGVYPKEMQQALQLFTTLPCAETGVILIAECPEAAQIIALSNRGFAQSLPKDLRGPKFDKLDKWMASFDQNQKACKAIHEFLLNGATNGTISIGFHRMRNQKILFDRLSMIGIRKRFLKNGRQFLRDKITCDASAFRSVVDLICIHGADGRRERFWNALGAEVGPQLHVQSEVQYDLSINANGFAQLVDQVTNGV